MTMLDKLPFISHQSSSWPIFHHLPWTGLTKQLTFSRSCILILQTLTLRVVVRIQPSQWSRVMLTQKHNSAFG